MFHFSEGTPVALRGPNCTELFGCVLGPTKDGKRFSDSTVGWPSRCHNPTGTQESEDSKNMSDLFDYSKSPATAEPKEQRTRAGQG